MGDPVTWPSWRALLPHIDALLSHTTTDTAATAAILNATALFFLDQGMSLRAIEYLQRVLTARKQILGPKHPDIFAFGNNLASAYQKAGRTAEAIELLEEALPDAERFLGTDHPATLSARNNLAGAYQAAGRLGEAIKLFERTLTDAERILGPDHPNTLTSRNNLASAYKGANCGGDHAGRANPRRSRADPRH
ncbi:tetratricopeptide repeat protein [Nocardia beijingensis]|nr:tetratricopeptide repeat protein [Nocardia beijingensis]